MHINKCSLSPLKNEMHCFTNSTGPIVCKLCNKIFNRTLIFDLLEAVLSSALIITQTLNLDL